MERGRLCDVCERHAGGSQQNDSSQSAGDRAQQTGEERALLEGEHQKYPAAPILRYV
jgi:hypothetical protein